MVLWQQFRRSELDADFVERAREAEWHLVVGVVHRRTGVGPDVEGLVDRQDRRSGLGNALGCDLFAIHLQYATEGRINSVVRSLFTRDRNDELISIDLGGSGDVRAQLLCKCGDDPHSQSLARTEVKIGGQSNAIIAHRYERFICIRSDQADVNMSLVAV